MKIRYRIMCQRCTLKNLIVLLRTVYLNKKKSRSGRGQKFGENLKESGEHYGMNSMGANSTPTKVEFNGLTQVPEQTIVLLGQVVHSTTYHKQMKILNALLKDTKKASPTVRGNEELLNIDDSALFEMKFKNGLRKKAKSRPMSKRLFRTIYFSQTACSIQIMQGDQMSVKKDSITSPQGVTNHVWDSTFIRKEPSLSNSQIPPPVRNLENKYIKNLTNVHPLVKELSIKIPGDISLP